MKIPITQNLNPTMVMRRAGYGQLRNGSFARRLGSGLYPRFHVYIENNIIKLHLDQKQASYKGVRAHSGEYDSEVVIQEGERIKQVIMSLSKSIESTSISQKEKKVF